MPETPVQVTKAQLDAMSPEQVMEALKAGQLHTLLTTADPPPDPAAEAIVSDGRITVADLRDMTPEAIVDAHRAGHLDHLLLGTSPASPGADRESGARGTRD